MINNYSPFFTVIIPTFNREKTIDKCLDSVFNQSFLNFEVIVIDDHSSDNTLNYLSKITDQRLRVFSNQRKKGACGARNTGAMNANGNWLAFLDSDDLWEKNKLQKIFNVVSKLKSGCCYSGYFRIRNGRKESIIDGFSGSHLPALYVKNIVRGISLFVVDKVSFWRVGGFDEDFESKQDLDLYIRLAKICTFEYVGEALVTFNPGLKDRITLNSKSKLNGYLSFKDKYWEDIPQYSKHQHLKSILKYSLKENRFFLCFKLILEYIILKISN